MDFSPTIWEGIFNAARSRRTMPGRSSYGRRYKSRRGKVSKKLTPFKRYNSKALVNRAKTKTLTKLIKKVTLKQSETCYRSKAVTSNNLFHDVIRGVDIWDSYTGATTIFPAQGSSDGDRKGDEIYTTGIMYRGAFQIPHDRRNLVFKMWFLSSNTSQGDPTVYSNFFHNVTGDAMLDPVQTDRWKGVRYLGQFRCRAVDQTTGDPNDKTIHVKRWIPMKRKVTFINDGSTTPANLPEQGRLIIVPYDTITTLITDILITRSEHSFTLYYKDP